jgi:membrane protein DedA with SNARE-associated domain
VTALLSQELLRLIAAYGLVAVFVLMAAESCGLPFPSEVIMPGAGLLAAAGHLPLPAVILAGAVGNLAGSLVAYGLAARFGEPLLLGPGRRIGFSPAHLALSQRWFDRHGSLTVFVGRLLPVIRTYISFPAGLARTPLGRFSVLTLVGALPWCAALALAGYTLGENADRISRPVQLVSVLILVGVVVLLAVWFRRGRRGTERTLAKSG